MTVADEPEPRRAVVLAAGELRRSERLTAIARNADVVVAADGGLRHAVALGVRPDAIVGDFDSVTSEDLDAFPTIVRKRHPPAKDALDLELAIDEVRGRGARHVTILGALGGRLDHTLAALLIGARLRREGLECALHGNDADALPLAQGDAVGLGAVSGTTFSVVALDDRAEVSIRGARYPLDRERLPFGVGRGMSNVAAEGSTVTCHRGLVVVLVDRSGDAREAKR